MLLLSMVSAEYHKLAPQHSVKHIIAVKGLAGEILQNPSQKDGTGDRQEQNMTLYGMD